MSKSSKSCGYTGRMHSMNRVNQTKADYTSNQSKAHQGQMAQENHPKHKSQFPEVAAAQARDQEPCRCSIVRKK